jgi:hypothetical protein
LHVLPFHSSSDPKCILLDPAKSWLDMWNDPHEKHVILDVPFLSFFFELKAT